MKTDEEVYQIIEDASKLQSNEIDKAIIILKKLINEISESSYYYPIAISNLIQYYENIENHTEVVYYTKKNINDLKKNKYKIEKPDIGLKYLQIALLKLAISSHLIGQLQQSVDAYNEIITLHEQVTGLDDKYCLMAAYQGIGSIQAALAQKMDDDSERIKHFRMARSNMKKAIQINPQFYPLYAHLAVIYNHLGEIEKSEESYIKSLLNPMKDDIENANFDKVLYKYVPIDKYTIINLINDTIFLNDPKEFNDPFDCPVYRGSNYRNNIAFTNVLNRIQISCFSKRKDSILMWSHYADSHRGICIGYRIDDKYCKKESLHTGYVDYQKDNFLNKGIKHFKSLLNDTFYIKNLEWKYEEEFRLIGYDLDENSISSPKIEEVIFGINTLESDKNVILNILENKGNVLIQEVVDNEDDNINLVIRNI